MAPCSKRLTTVTVTKGVATVTLPRIAKKGRYSITASYTGSPTVSAAALAKVRLRVT